MIYIKLPYIPFEPVGGVRTAFDYVLRLNTMAGKTIATILADSKYLKSWLPNEYHGVPVRPTSTKITSNDTLIFPEVIASEAAQFPQVKTKILLVLNWKYVPSTLTEQDLQSFGFTRILTNSKFSQTKLREQFGNFPIAYIPQVITPPQKNIMIPFQKRAQHSVLILNRKNTHHIPGILKFLEGIRHTATIVNNIHPDQMQTLYASHQYFINLGYPEGFCRPSAEAMAAGCIVIGFTGGGGSDFMWDKKNCFVAQDGDEKKLIELFNQAIHLPMREKLKISRCANQTIAHQYAKKFQMFALYTIFKNNIAKKFLFQETSKFAQKKMQRKMNITQMKKNHAILEYQLFQQKQQYQELVQSKIFAIWQKYHRLKTWMQSSIRSKKSFSI